MPMKDKEESLKRQRERYHRDKDKKRDETNRKAKEYRAKNKEKINARRRAIYKKDPEKAKKRTRDWHFKNRDEILKKNAKKIEDLRNETFTEYGGQCVCCDESNFLFLTIDHIYNDGYQDRKKIAKGGHQKPGAGVHTYRMLKKLKYPKDRYQLLCFNCNLGRARMPDKICPHKKEIK